MLHILLIFILFAIYTQFLLYNFFLSFSVTKYSTNRLCQIFDELKSKHNTASRFVKSRIVAIGNIATSTS